MNRLMNKKGFTLIEVVCSMSLFMAIMLVIMVNQCICIKVKKNNDILAHNAVLMECIKNEIISNLSYKDIVDIRNAKKLYLNSALDITELQAGNLRNKVTEIPPQEMAYIVLEITGEKVLKIELLCFMKQAQKEEPLHCTFYKGEYF